MSVTADARVLFTERHASYVRFIRAVRYPQGLRAYFLRSPLLRPGVRVLEAGCGSGALTLAVHDAAARRRVAVGALDAFDLTAVMLARLRHALERRGIATVRLAEADVLRLDMLPPAWTGYDLVVSASMLEYVPRARFVHALRGLRARLVDGGSFVLFMTRQNPLTRVMIGRWWRANLYTRAELERAFREAGFTDLRFPGFPLGALHLSLWGHAVEATSTTARAG